MTRRQLFLSYAGKDEFEATLLQEWLEHKFREIGLKVWTFHRDQPRDEANISWSLKDIIHDSLAVVFLLSPYTLEVGATQWMELAYADAFSIPTFILLHHLSYVDVLRTERGVPPLILQSQCTPAIQWKTMEENLRKHLGIIDEKAVIRHHPRKERPHEPDFRVLQHEGPARCERSSREMA